MKIWHKHRKSLIIILIFALFVSFLLPDFLVGATTQPGKDYGKLAYKHVYHLSKELGGRRITASKYEDKAANYIKDTLKFYGYQVTLQPFSYELGGELVHSQNVVAVKPGKSKTQLILGAHYDQVDGNGSEGAQDNGSGVGVLLELAERLKDQDLDYTVKFVAFGAEETGLHGSGTYVKLMSDEETANTLAMVNYDSVLAGDYLYVYSGQGGVPWVREKALELSDTLGLDLITQEGVSPNYVAGETGDWSDHAPFNALGIPLAYFESTNWTIEDKAGNNLEGYIETEELGSIMHTENDNLDTIEAHFPGRGLERLKTVVAVSEQLILQAKDIETKMDSMDNFTSQSFIKGYPDGTFRPDQAVTRGEVAAMVSRLEDLPIQTQGEDQFSDIDGWYRDSINALAEANLVKGYEDGSFKAEQQMTRAEFVTLIDNLEGRLSSSSPYSDINSHWAKAAIDSLSAKGYLYWLADAQFKPDQKVSRAEVVMTLNAYLGQSVNIEDFANKTMENFPSYRDLDSTHPSYYDILVASKAFKIFRNY